MATAIAPRVSHKRFWGAKIVKEKTTLVAKIVSNTIRGLFLKLEQFCYNVNKISFTQIILTLELNSTYVNFSTQLPLWFTHISSSSTNLKIPWSYNRLPVHFNLFRVELWQSDDSLVIEIATSTAMNKNFLFISQISRRRPRCSSSPKCSLFPLFHIYILQCFIPLTVCKLPDCTATFDSPCRYASKLFNLFRDEW